MQKEDMLCLVAVIVIISLVAGFFAWDRYSDWQEDKEKKETRSNLFVEEGDRITFEVSAWLEDGRYFYTTEKEVDEDPLLPKTPSYSFFTDEPEFSTAGEELSSKFNPGFNDNVQYMKIKEEKTFRVTPENGYGWENESLIKEIPKMDSLPLYAEETRIDFQNQYNPTDIPLVIGQRFNHIYWKWQIEIVEINDDIVKYRNEPDAGFEISVLPWNAEVTGISEKDGKVLITHKITNDDIYSTVDPIQLTDYDESYIEVQDIQNEIGIGPVTGVITKHDNDSFTIDFNDERSGVNIYYKVKIINIEKA